MRIVYYVQPSIMLESIITTEVLSTPDSEVALLLDETDLARERYELVWINGDYIGQLAEDQDEQCYLLITDEGFEALLPFEDLDDAHEFGIQLHRQLEILAEIRAES